MRTELVALSKGVKLIIALAVSALTLAFGGICRAAQAEKTPGIFSGLPESLTAQSQDQAIDPTVSRARLRHD